MKKLNKIVLLASDDAHHSGHYTLPVARIII